ncbi:hypothetical protein H8S20_07555 [Clostridium sp. NSJ-6]|uniref:RiboL-PSP-HEPN domain-containing protein n=2 Tax=Clostridium hominis TaxID=2763036 RepID=A0ABR7DBG1_9CLOT|nr:hypothetical protein [Clostridium hominis]
MIRVNSMRLQNIVNNYMEILSDLDEDSKLYSSMAETDKYFKQVSNSFRNNMKELYTVFEDYIAFSLSAVGVAVTDNRLREYILNAYKLKIIPEDFYEFYNKTLNIRNTFAHQYKKPTTKELVKLYKDNRDILKNFESFINDRLKIHIKNNRKDLLSLYDE